MPVSRALRRLLHVRAMEEEQQRQTLEFALSELHALEQALIAARDRARRGHRLLVTCLQNGEIADRTAAMVEVETARRHAAVLAPRIVSAEMLVTRSRQEYLDKRLERRQAQTLIEQAETKAAIESGRRDQQSLDETFGTLHYRKGRECAVTGAGHRPLSLNLEPGSTEDSSSIPNSEPNPNL